LKIKFVNSNNDDTLETIEWIKQIIYPHGYFLIGHKVSTQANKINKRFDAVYTDGFLTGVSGVMLLDSNDNIIDKLSWGEKNPLANNPPVLAREGGGFAIGEDGGLKTGQSLERKANELSTPESLLSGADKYLGNGYDTDNNALDFVLQNSLDPQNTDDYREPNGAPLKILGLKVAEKAKNNSSYSVLLEWIAPLGADGINENLTYDIRYSENPINESNFFEALQAPNIPPVASAGQAESAEIPNLILWQSYYFAIKAKDIIGQESPVSVIFYHTPPPPPC